MHTCRAASDGNAPSMAELKPGGKKPQKKAAQFEVKGCTKPDGSCSARFPRDTFDVSSVDPIDGYLHVKKLEPMINTLTPLVTYLLRCILILLVYFQELQ